MINKSFQLLRTNPVLTSNLKLVVTSDYDLYLESFNTNNELSNIKYKHFPIKKSEYLENKIPYFYKGLPIEIAFDIRYDGDNKVIQNDYNKQFDTTYYSGGYYIEDQWYNEEFEYLAPLYIRKNNLPEGFIILRVDEPSEYNLNSNNYFELNNLTYENFSTIIDNWKCVKFFDMKYSSNLGEWLYLNYANNDRIPKSSFDFHVERTEFSYWYGLDYKTGIYTYKSLYMDDRDEIETPHFKWEKFITEGFKRSGLIYPYILNLKFLFDDTPATPNYLRKYSMNRYYGFYIDKMEYVGSITSYRTPELIPETYLINNIILSGSTGITEEQLCNLDFYGLPSPNPFVEEWDDKKNYYIFIDNTNDFYRKKTISGFYPVKRMIKDNSHVYKIISDEILDNYWNTGYTNIKTVNITYNGYNILSGLTSDFFIDKYKDCDGLDKFMYGDLYLIKIDDKYHVIKYSSGQTEVNELITDPVTGDINDYKYYINTDYAINLNDKYLEYWILGKNSEFYKKIDVFNGVDEPITLPIYRIKFSDIKDFDFDRVNTQFSNFDYEKSQYTDINEEKLYAFDYNDDAIPPSKRVGKEGSPDQYKINNISSEYIADDELYEIYNIGTRNIITNTYGEYNIIYDLNDIWRKNQSIVKWGFMGSISHSDYPYKLNNNYEVGGIYNRTTDPFYTIPDIVSKNLDYFYILGNLYSGTTGNTIYYKNQSINIQNDFISNQLGVGFDLDAYFGGLNKDLNFDYFTYFFKNKMIYEDNSTLLSKSYDKYSVFNYGDDNVPSITLFKGLKIKLREIKNIFIDENRISKFLFGSKSYNDYKFSIIFNENHNGIDSGLLNNRNYIDTTTNTINVIMNEKFKNVLIVINARLSNDDFRFNDLSIFNPKEGLYYGKKINGDIISETEYNPKLFTANNFINALNSLSPGYGFTIKYYYIKENEGYFHNGYALMNRNDSQSNFNSNSTMDSIPGWQYKFPPFLIQIETPTKLEIYNNCYQTNPFYVNSVDDDYVATLLSFNEYGTSRNTIYRFSGPYEPIFKDISLFKSGFFCYNNISSTEVTLSGLTTTNASIVQQIPGQLESNLDWSNINLGICNSLSSINVIVPKIETELSTKYLSIRGFDFSSVPSDSTILGIELKLTRKSLLKILDEPDFQIYTREGGVYLSKNCLQFTNLSENKALEEIDPDYYWREDTIDIKYGGESDLWNYDNNWTGSTLTGQDLINSTFGVVVNVVVFNNSEKVDVLLSSILCAALKVKYEYESTIYYSDTSLYFDENYKFDTTLNDFGIIDEIIYSKVNENLNILNSSIDMYNIYPSIDKFGYSYTNRFIFKSSWDKEFFIRTNNELIINNGII